MTLGGSEPAALAVKELEPAEAVLASSLAHLRSPEGAGEEVDVTITRLRVVVATSVGSTSFPFAQVVELAQRAPSIRLSGVGFSVVLTFPEDAYSEIEEAIYLGCVRLSPTWEMLRVGARRFLELDGRPVATWAGCPVCEVPLAERQEHVVHCMRCGRFYSDPGFQLLVSEPARRRPEAQPHRAGEMGTLDGGPAPIQRAHAFLGHAVALDGSRTDLPA